MKILLTFIASISCFLTAANTQSNSVKRNVIYIVVADSTIFKTSLFLINPNDVQTIDIPSHDEAEKKWGPLMGQDAVVITPKPFVKLLKASEMFSLFKVKLKSQLYTVFVDGSRIGNNAYDMIAAKNVIEKIKVDDIKNRLNITTKLHHIKRKPGEVMIR